MSGFKKALLRAFRPQKYAELVLEENRQDLADDVERVTGVRLTTRERRRMDAEDIVDVYSAMSYHFDIHRDWTKKRVLSTLVKKGIIDRPKHRARVSEWASGEPYLSIEDRDILDNDDDEAIARRWGRSKITIQSRRYHLKKRGR